MLGSCGPFLDAAVLLPGCEKLSYELVGWTHGMIAVALRQRRSDTALHLFTSARTWLYLVGLD